MKRLLLTGLTLLLVISGATVAFGLVGDDSPSRTTSSTTSTAEDISGPCDEAEHANDPRCAGGAREDDRGRDDDHGRGDDDRGRDHPEDDGMDDDDAGEDISGPCDEAEHANDPECTDVPTVPGDDDDRVDNSGPGSLNSGPGNAEDDGETEDHSGPGSGDDDSSGSGGGDSSGHGSGDDD